MDGNALDLILFLIATFVAALVAGIAGFAFGLVVVLAGFTVVRGAIGGAGRAPAFEIASAGLIVAIGLWLLI